MLPGVTRTEIWERSGTGIAGIPAEMVMEVEDLVEAALVGFDRREAVTIRRCRMRPIGGADDGAGQARAQSVAAAAGRALPRLRP